MIFCSLLVYPCTMIRTISTRGWSDQATARTLYLFLHLFLVFFMLWFRPLQVIPSGNILTPHQNLLALLLLHGDEDRLLDWCPNKWVSRNLNNAVNILGYIYFTNSLVMTAVIILISSWGVHVILSPTCACLYCAGRYSN
jgi:hypothetical protein